jgi:hypothetical protein
MAFSPQRRRRPKGIRIIMIEGGVRDGERWTEKSQIWGSRTASKE